MSGRELLRRSRERPVEGLSRRGFTLLEVLVAMAILGLGIVSVLQLLGTSSRSAGRAQIVTEAVFIAEELMEEIVTLNEQGLRARARESGVFAEHERRIANRGLRGTPAARRLGDGPFRPFDYAVSVTPDHSETGLYRVEVAVSWPGPPAGRVDVTTLRRFIPEDLPEAFER